MQSRRIVPFTKMTFTTAAKVTVAPTF